jgi:hypothetical protein
MASSFKVLAYCSLFFLSIGTANAQKAKIFVEDKEIVSIISAQTTTEIYTQSGTIPFSIIKKILFEKFESKYESLYSKLSKSTTVEYGDGTDLGEISPIVDFLKKPEPPNEDIFIKIDSVPLSKETLYAKAKEYIAYSFKSAQNVIQLDDKDNGKIIAKGNFISIKKLGIITYVSTIEFTFTIDVREGRFRGIIEDLREVTAGGGSFKNEKPAVGTFVLPKGNWDKIKEQGRIDAQAHLEDFASFMKAKPKVDDF